jgi:hypothetical protein
VSGHQEVVDGKDGEQNHEERAPEARVERRDGQCSKKENDRTK